MKLSVSTPRGYFVLLVFYAALGAAFVAQGVLTARFFLADGGSETSITLAGTVMSACLAGVGLWFIVQAWRKLRETGAALLIGPEGIRDPRLARRAIPWGDVRNPRVRAAEPQGAMLLFDLADGGAARAGITARATRMVAVNQRLGFSYRVTSAELSVAEMTEAVAPYATVEPAD